MKAVFLALLLVLTAACGAYRFPAESPTGSGTVSGQVTSVPCSPVQPVTQPPCAGRPVPGLEIDFSDSGTTVSTTTGPKGNYSVELAAATWKVTLKTYMRIISGPPTVTVDSGSSVVANYLLDSGMRVPVAQEPSLNPTHPEGGAPA